MSQYLPTKSFGEIEVAERKEEILSESILDTKDDQKHKDFKICDSEYPQFIH